MGRQASFLITLLVLGLTSCHQSTSVAAGTGAGTTGDARGAQSKAGGDAVASHKTLTDLPGITSEKDLHSELVPLTPADVQFYMKNIKATLDRLQHPTPQDLADLAEAKRLRQLQMAGQTKMAEDMKAGNMQKAMNEDMFRPTPEQQATLERTSVDPGMLAKDAGMPDGQWRELSEAVEYAAGDLRPGGDGDDGPVAKLTAEQLAKGTKIKQIRAANQALVAPDVPEITRLRTLLGQASGERIQSFMSQ
jgi:hypothetical protein